MRFFIRLLAIVIFFISPLITDAQQMVGFYRPGHMLEDNWATRKILQAYKNDLESGANMKKWWKGESTIGLVLTAAPQYDLRSKYITDAGSSVASYDTIKKGTGRTKLSFQVNGNSNHLLFRLAPNNIISLSIGIQGDLMRYELPDYDMVATAACSPVKLNYFRLGAPITIDYKFGSDVDFDPNVRFCFSAGAGVVPYWGTAILNLDQSQSFTHIAPYVYATIGFYAWSCWKIRAAYSPGNTQFFDNHDYNIGGVVNTLNAHTSGTFTIGIGIMRHSHDWGTGRAERTGWGLFGGGGNRHGRGWSNDETAHMRMF